MSLLHRLRSLWRNLVHRDAAERDLDDELQATLEFLVDEKIAAGLPPWEARRAAAMELGGIEPLKEQVRDAWTGRFLDALLQDARYALRHIRRAPGFAAAAILTLALGIGANTAMFSVLNTLVLKRLDIADPEGLYSLSSYNDRGQKRYIPMPTVIDLNVDGPFREACGYNGGALLAVEANGIPSQGIAAMVTGRCFSVFGVTPVLGRGIIDDDAPIMTAGRKVVVISDRLWRQLFNRDASVIGSTIKVDTSEATVIGVLPAPFRGINADTGIDLFAPPDSILPAAQGRRPVAQEVLGRLKPGVTFAQAAAQFDAMWPALLHAAIAMNRDAAEGNSILGPSVRLESMARGLSGTREQHAPAVLLILSLTALLLLLACVNLGGLLLTRLSARSTELGVRLALGGSRGRIAQQMLVESLCLSLAGAALAIPVAYLFLLPIPSFLDPGFAGWELSFAPDLRVLAGTAAIGVGVGLALTSLPVWFALRRPSAVRFTWDRTMTGATSRWTRGLLVAQVALSVVIVVGAGLLTRSLYLIQHNDPGVDTANKLSVDLMALPGGTRGLNAEVHYPALVEKLIAIPGVRAAGFAAVFPRRIADISSDLGFAGEDFTGVRSSLDSVSTNFFEILGIPILAGRVFTPADTAGTRRVVVLSESLARALAPQGDLVGRRLRFQTQRAMQDLEVIGIVGNATQGHLRRTAPHVMYTAALQSPGFSSPNLLLHVNGDTAGIAAAVRQIVAEHGREFVWDIDTLNDLLASGPARERMSAAVAIIVSALAAVLAVIGVHGVLAYSVARRRREIGVRLAVGALPQQVAATVMREAGVLTLLGVAVGLPAAFVSASALRSLLFGISESDAMTFGGAAILFLFLGALAGVLPARKAARVDPVIALRAD